MFSEQHEVLYTDEYYRFTCTDNAIYATCLGWPEGASKTKTMGRLYAKGISSVTMLGLDDNCPGIALKKDWRYPFREKTM